MSRQHFIIPPRFRGLMDEGRSVTKAVTGEEPSVLAVIIDCHPLGCVSAAHFATLLEHAIIFMNAFWMLSSGNRCVCCIQSPARFHTPPHPTPPPPPGPHAVRRVARAGCARTSCRTPQIELPSHSPPCTHHVPTLLPKLRSHPTQQSSSAHF